MSEIIKTKTFELAVYAKGDPGSKKIALVLPGRLDTKDYIHMTSLVDTLANEGFYAISFDPPGSWESPGGMKEYSTTSYLSATNELIEKLGNRPTFLAGHSRGGADAMLASSSNKCVNGLALVMASYKDASSPMSGEIKDGEYVTFRDLPPGIDKNGPRKQMKLSLEYFGDSKKYKPREALEKFNGPKLLICATKDAFTSPMAVKEIYESLSGPKEFLELNTEHDYRSHADMVNSVNDAVLSFAKKYL